MPEVRRCENLREAKVTTSAFFTYIDRSAKPRDDGVWTRIQAVYDKWLHEVADPKFRIPSPAMKLPILAPSDPGSWKIDVFNDFLDVPLFLAKNKR